MNTSTSSQNPTKPENWPQAFELRLNAGDLDAVMTLYEPDAQFVTTSGEILVGHDAIRKALVALIEAKTHFRSRIARAVTVGDIAQLYTDFEGTRAMAREKQSPFTIMRSRFCAASPTAPGS